MSFFTSLTGLRAANTELAVTSNNIANAGTTGFKKSKATFGDIFAKSPLQTQTVGQGVALKTITQEFSQGSIEFSSNTLDLAITGDGFFPLESQDGQTQIFSRSGAFILNETGNIVNRSGQRLLASQVDGSGKAIGGELQTIAISPQTVGEAQSSSQVDLSLNLPSSAEIIDLPFDAENPATYNKSSVIDLYDTGGNAYPATIYYVKTSGAESMTSGGSTYNPQANQPTNKWQTYVLIDGVRVEPALQQAVNKKGEGLYVNRYGEVRSESEIADQLVLGKTPKFTLDGLDNVQQSIRASITSGEVPQDLGVAQGFNFFQDLADPDGAFDLESLENFFTIDIDGSGNPVSVDISELALEDREINGLEIARFIENQLNKSFGDSRYFDLTNPADRRFSVNYQLGDVALQAEIDLEAFFPDAQTQSEVTTDQLVAAIQAGIDVGLGADTLTVSYDDVGRNFLYAPNAVGAEVSLEAGPAGVNNLFGLSAIATGINENNIDSTGFNVIPNGDFIRPLNDQRYGIEVKFNAVTNSFEISSGTTGDASSLKLNFDVGTAEAPAFNAAAANFLGYPVTAEDPDLEVVEAINALRGLDSIPAVTFGAPMSLNIDEFFSVTSSNNRFNVTVDGISGTINLAVGSNYTIDSFTTELARQINALSGADGTSVSGVKVEYDNDIKSLVFTTGTAGSSSFIKVSGDSVWGLANASPGRGTTTSWINPQQAIELVDGVPSNIFIDEFGTETTDPTGFNGVPDWSPIFLDKGELTFDKQGSLLSPPGGQTMETAFLRGGGSLDLVLDFSGTTQFNQAFNVKYQKQDGLPEGDLVGLDIGDDGLIVASYSNGSQVSVGKVLLANFPSADGLSARGDSAFLSTANSGDPLFGEPGSAAFGSIRAGALERSNVDLTSELIGLITAQRNFQANAKAIETSSTLTSTILNI